MFSRDHVKVSYKLRRLLAQGANRRDIKQAIPSWYYPHLDETHGLNFLIHYMREYAGYDLVDVVDTFVERGMDLNTRVDDGQRTLLHVMLSDTHKYGEAAAELLDNYISQFDVLARDENDRMPLDTYLYFDGVQHDGRVVYKLLMAEVKSLYSDAPAGAQREYLQKRLIEVIDHLSGDELSRLVPSQVPYSVRDQNNRTLFLSLVEKSSAAAVARMIDFGDFKLPDPSEPVVDVMIKRYRDYALPSIQRLCEHHQAVVTANTLHQAVASRNVELLTYIYDRLLMENTKGLLQKADATPEQIKNAQFARDCLRDGLLMDVLKSYDLDFVKSVYEHEFFAGHGDIDAIVPGSDKNLLMYYISRGQHKYVQTLLDMGADIRQVDGIGDIALELARQSRCSTTLKLVQGELARLNKSGNFTRVHDNQIACKNGVLTYIFDFYAAQVVVRDDETKAIAATPFAEFARSGSHLLGEAARTLTTLGGDANGYDAVERIAAVPAQKKSPISKKPAA